MSKNEIRDNRQKEWFWLDNEYLNGYAKHLGVSCTVVYLTLCRYANNETQTCFPSMELIAQENGIGSRNTVSKAIKTLEEWNIIKIETSYNKKTKKRENNIYTLLAKSEWKKKPCTISEHGKEKPCTIIDESHAQPLSSNNTNINNTNISKQSLQAPINEIMDLFKGVNPTHDELFRNTTERKALEYLVDKFGAEKISRTIQALPGIVSQPYAPKITKPTELKRDFAKLIIFHEQNKNITQSKTRRIA